MAVRQVSADSSVAPNLVPMVDIMFLLLLFLMVGADMGNRELEEVKLPVAKTAVEENPTTPADDRITLNVYHAASSCPAYEATQLCGDRAHWAVGVRGNDFQSPAKLSAFLKGLAEDDCARNNAKTPELHVLIRADRSALYEQVQAAMGCCADARIYKVEVGAATSAEQETR